MEDNKCGSCEKKQACISFMAHENAMMHKDTDMEKLHEEVTELIEEYRKEHGEPPKDMMVLWDYLHEKHIETATRIRVKQGIYKM